MPAQVKVFLLFFSVGFGFFCSCSSPSKISNPIVKQDALESSSMTLDGAIYKKVDFIDNSNAKVPYLSLAVFFDSVRPLKTKIENQEKLSLQSRGEAHITILTPAEWLQITKRVPAKLIVELAHLNRLQDIPFQAVCVGRGVKTEDQKTLSTYFLVVDAPKLIELRRSIQSVYITRGGSTTDFDPNDFQPHITSGFTVRDLHSQDGVVKNKASCFSQIHIL